MALAEYRNVTKTFGDTVAVNGIDLDIGENRIVGLLGPNGSGKTTLLKITAGLLLPDSGSVTVAGMCIGQGTKAVVSFLPERTYLDETMTVDEILSYFADFYADFDTVKAKEMLSRLNISTSGRIKTFSKGTREKVQLALVMSRRARLYLLDEPIAGVDPAAREFIINNFIKEYNERSTVVISTHLIADVEPLLDDIVFIKYGNIILSRSANEIRSERGVSVDALFREEFRC